MHEGFKLTSSNVLTAGGDDALGTGVVDGVPVLEDAEAGEVVLLASGSASDGLVKALDGALGHIVLEAVGESAAGGSGRGEENANELHIDFGC